MHRRTILLAAAVLATLVAGCTGTSSTTPVLESTTTTSFTPATSAPTTTATTIPPAPCLAGEPEPVESGVVARFGEVRTDATRLSGIDTEDFGAGSGCERIVLEFATAAAAPATAVGITTVERPPGTGVVRLSLASEVVETAIADLRIEGTFAAGVYVVSGEDGLFVDVHLSGATAVRAFPLERPARIVIDLSAGNTAVRMGTAAADAVMVLPRPGEAVYPLTVEGYARGRSATVAVSLVSGGSAVESSEVPVAPYPWVAFSVTFPTGPSGRVDVVVGDLVLPMIMN